MIAAIELAIIERIRSATEGGVLGYKLKAIQSYDGLLADEEEVKRLKPSLPAALVFFLEEKPAREIGNGKWVVEVEFTVLAVATSKHNESSRRHGAAGAPGIYQMAADIRTLLVDQRLGLDIGYIEFIRSRSVRLSWLSQLEVTAMGVDFKTTYSLVAAPDAGAAALPAGQTGETLLAAMNRAAGITDFTAVHVDWTAPRPSAETIDLEAP
jgi:phage gp37-like protein